MKTIQLGGAVMILLVGSLAAIASTAAATPTGYCAYKPGGPCVAYGADAQNCWVHVGFDGNNQTQWTHAVCNMDRDVLV